MSLHPSLSKNCSDLKSQFLASLCPCQQQTVVKPLSRTPIRCTKSRFCPFQAEDLVQAQPDPTGLQGTSSSPECPLPRQFSRRCAIAWAPQSTRRRRGGGAEARYIRNCKERWRTGRREEDGGPHAEMLTKTRHVSLLGL